MKRRFYIGLFAAGLVVNLAVAAFQRSAGYMDADYYYAGGIQLSQGHGFNELAIWNYLNDPSALPSPSHGYWYPLASMIAAGGMILAGSTSYAAARGGFIVIAALIPPLAAALAIRLTGQQDLALTAGVLSILPTYFTAFMPVTDNYGLYIVLGAAFFLLADRGARLGRSLVPVFGAGLSAGLMSLARSDGVLWVLAGIAFIVLRTLFPPETRDKSAGSIRDLPVEIGAQRRAAIALSQIGTLLLGFLLIALPWYLRNYRTWGAFLAPGSSRALMLRNYADTFAFPASRLTLTYLLGAGWHNLLSVRIQALLANLDATGNLQISLFLLPFALVGLWGLRRDTIIQIGSFVWLILLVVMSLLFPFAGPRGSFTHADAALYTVWWGAAVAGVGATLAWTERKGWRFIAERRRLVLLALILVNTLFSVFLVQSRVIALDWDRFSRVYTLVEAKIRTDGAPPNLPVMVVDPPAYFTTNRRPSIVVPDEDTSKVRRAAEKFGAGYLVLESGYLRTPSLKRLYDSPSSDPTFRFVGQVEDAKIYRINH
jgi:hypothetical protein